MSRGPLDRYECPVRHPMNSKNPSLSYHDRSPAPLISASSHGRNETNKTNKTKHTKTHKDTTRRVSPCLSVSLSAPFLFFFSAAPAVFFFFLLFLPPPHPHFLTRYFQIFHFVFHFQVQTETYPRMHEIRVHQEIFSNPEENKKKKLFRRFEFFFPPGTTLFFISGFFQRKTFLRVLLLQLNYYHFLISALSFQPACAANEISPPRQHILQSFFFPPFSRKMSSAV